LYYFYSEENIGKKILERNSQPHFSDKANLHEFGVASFNDCGTS
jgi:hypothetical protein